MTSDILRAALRLLGPERHPLILWPGSGRGWFDGTAVVAWDPVEVVANASLEQAARALEAQYEGGPHALTAALIAYDGTATLMRYPGGLRREGDRWAVFGALKDAEQVLALARDDVPARGRIPADSALLLDPGWDLDGRTFRAAVEATRERIAAGDVYVMNLTARLTGTVAATPAECFSALVDRAGADMSAFLDGWPGHTPWVASVSPELFLRVRTGGFGERRAETQPIKGTRPRSADPSADAASARALAEDPKERAEHVMVVDLERNDLGIACIPGTVHVDPLYEVTTTPYCHQLVSTVRGALRPDATFIELLAGMFPCGSVTGAPKRAAMRIISGLERSPRHSYCGSLVVAMPGRLDSSVLIRTLEGVPGGAGDGNSACSAQWGAGCGITYDSDPVAEQLEALLKASPVLGDGAPPTALRETMRVTCGRVPLLGRHLARLAAGGAGPSVLARVREAVAEQVARPEAAAAYARLGLTVTPDGAVAASLSSESSSLDLPGGPRLVPVEVAEPPHLPASAAKPAVRRYWDRAHHAAQLAGGDQALLHLPDGSLVDGSTATVWLLVDGELVTPPAPPAVAGVCRELVFDVAGGLGIPAREAALTLDDYARADEVALGNGVGLLVPAAGRGGPVTARIAEAIARAASEAGRRALRPASPGPQRRTR